MKTLCIETSSKICSVALLENTNLIDKIEFIYYLYFQDISHINPDASVLFG